MFYLEEDLNYHENFSTVAKIITMKLVISLAVVKGYHFGIFENFMLTMHFHMKICENVLWNCHLATPIKKDQKCVD